MDRTARSGSHSRPISGYPKVWGERKDTAVDAITLLKRDHDEMLALFQVLASGSSLSDADLASRRDLVNRLITVASRHEAAEKQHFWPAVRRALPNGDELADHAHKQETDAKHLLDELGRTEPTDPVYGELVTQFISKAGKYIAYEQEFVWPALVGVLGNRELNELGEQLARAKIVAPSRSRPHTPETWTVLRMR
jgi:Hemerythrin HHE cation binding domain